MVGTYKPVSRIEVYLWEQFVGAVALDPGIGYYVFAFDPTFAKQKIDLSPLHMPVQDASGMFVFPGLPEETYKRLPALLADCLPDDFGNALVNAYMAEQGVSQDQITSLDRLAYMGKRAMGALEFVPSRGQRRHAPTALNLETLISAARAAVDGSVAGGNSHKVLQQILDVGTSAGGARAKAVIAINSTTKEIRSGQLEAPPGFEHWLLKFDGMGKDRDLGGTQGYGRIEYAYYLMAKAAGIAMSDSNLLEEGGRAHFLTKRFDRGPGSAKHHIQTLCAMDHLDYKKPVTHTYEQLFLVSQRLRLGHEAEVQIFRRMVFNVMAKNCDDHTKNISFLLRKGEVWQLAPAYDLTFSYNPESHWVNQHQMSVSGKFKGIKSADCLKLADRFGIGEAKAVIEEVRQIVMNWQNFAARSSISQREANRIASLHEAKYF